MAAGLVASSMSAQKKVYSIDYATTDWNFYVMDYTPEKGDGCIVSNNPMKGDDGGPSWYQYFIADLVPTKEGQSYTVVVNCKASEAVNVGMNMGWGWGDGESLGGTLAIPEDWTEVSVDYKKPVGATSCNVVLQPGTCTATIYIKSVTIYQNPEPSKYETEPIGTINYSDYTEYPYEDLGVAPVINDGILSFTPELDPDDPDNDSNQFYAMYNVKLEDDVNYGIITKIRGSKPGTITAGIGDWGEMVDASFDISTEWEEISLPIGVVPNASSFEEPFVMITAANRYDGTIEMEYCTLAKFTEIPPVVIPTEWVSMVGNCDANKGESENLIDRNPEIEGGLFGQEHDVWAMICDNPDGAGKVYYCPINADPKEAWDSQFFIYFNEAVPADTPIAVSFDYYCSDTRTIDTQAHGMPGSYNHYAFIGSLSAKREWQHHSWKGEITSAMAGAKGCHSIAFNLASEPAAATFYINNVVVEIEREVKDPSGVTTVETVKVPVKGVYNMMGVKVADSLDEVAAPGIYITNGKKYIKK